MSTKETKEIEIKKLEDVERRLVEDVFNEGKMDVLDEIHHPGYVGHWFTDEEPADLDDLREYVRSMREAFPDLTLDVEFMNACGDTVTTGFTASGTHEGEYMGIPATGKRGEVPGIMVHRYENDQIVEGWAVHDTLSQAQQLGVVPEEFHLSDFLETTLNLTKQDVLRRTGRSD